MIDISFLSNPCTVVWCSTQYEAELLLHGTSGVHPSIRRQLEPKVLNFNYEADDDGLGFRFEQYGDGSFDIVYANINYYRECEYPIIEFKDLIYVNDLGSFDNGFIDNSAALAALF